MALISHGMTDNHGTNGYEIGAFDPPPSTMAAQLINNLSTTSRPSRQVEQDDLQRLMTEVAELENNAAELSNIDVKLEHKHKLIYVFARAVLERLSNDDPFMNAQQLASQASEALDIFMSAIKELPGVLNFTLKPGESLQGRGVEPLWMWLFPRVLPLLGRRECETLTEKIKDFFYVSFQAVARSPKLWNLSSHFFSYFKECVTSTYRILSLY
jgi:serine/threonine-protein kinase ATR